MTQKPSFVVPHKRAVLIGTLALLVGGGGITYEVLRAWRKPPAEEARAVTLGEAPVPVSGNGKEGTPQGPLMVKMDPLVANLDEGDQLRYLKISLQLEVETEAQQRIQAALPRARHEALMYLSGLHLSDTQGLSGKQRIHRELSRRIADAVGHGLKRIYFDEFVVQ
jgi:flagellar protein FliL